MSLEEIAEYETLEGSQLNRAKEKLAYELTELVHGKEEADKALEAARAIFSSNQNSENMPATEIEESVFEDGRILVAELMVLSGLTPSRSEARRLIVQGGVSINGDKVTDGNATLEKTVFAEDVIIKKGKKVFHKIILK